MFGILWSTILLSYYTWHDVENKSVINRTQFAEYGNLPPAA